MLGRLVWKEWTLRRRRSVYATRRRSRTCRCDVDLSKSLAIESSLRSRLRCNNQRELLLRLFTHHLTNDYSDYYDQTRCEATCECADDGTEKSPGVNTPCLARCCDNEQTDHPSFINASRYDAEILNCAEMRCPQPPFRGRNDVEPCSFRRRKNFSDDRENSARKWMERGAKEVPHTKCRVWRGAYCRRSVCWINATIVSIGVRLVTCKLRNVRLVSVINEVLNSSLVRYDKSCVTCFEQQ